MQNEGGLLENGVTLGPSADADASPSAVAASRLRMASKATRELWRARPPPRPASSSASALAATGAMTAASWRSTSGAAWGSNAAVASATLIRAWSMHAPLTGGFLLYASCQLQRNILIQIFFSRDQSGCAEKLKWQSASKQVLKARSAARGRCSSCTSSSHSAGLSNHITALKKNHCIASRGVSQRLPPVCF
jgi:hypothetical protein